MEKQDIPNKTRTGQCLCGAVKFIAKDTPDTFSTCYCKDCQRWVGGAYHGMPVPTEKLEITGRDHIHVYNSSDFAERASCRKCGAALWWRLTKTKYFGKTSIPVGLLDDTSGLTLNHELFTDYKNNTNEIPKGVEGMTSTEVAALIATFGDEQ